MFYLTLSTPTTLSSFPHLLIPFLLLTLLPLSLPLLPSPPLPLHPPPIPSLSSFLFKFKEIKCSAEDQGFFEFYPKSPTHCSDEARRPAFGPAWLPHG